ncbi:RHTO0S01e08834g1_1 [Rhodotorula toruloides]|uniref:RHTO0S01e08834g1_1 n=1 Tax=Rhodotorula toruloides TaxID=5286 RepID=A0A061AMB7_RHOTO|nr:RHTO0S01e08834g1_1 [Rhodotorula toruloides]
MHLVTASPTSTAREKTSALSRWQAIVLERIEEEVRGKVARSGLNKAASGTFDPYEYDELQGSSPRRLLHAQTDPPLDADLRSARALLPPFSSESLPLSSASPRPSTPPAPPPRRRNSTVVKDSVDDALVRFRSRLTSSSPSPLSGSSCSVSTGVEGRAVSTPAWSVERRSTAPTRSARLRFSKIEALASRKPQDPSSASSRPALAACAPAAFELLRRSFHLSGRCVSQRQPRGPGETGREGSGCRDDIVQHGNSPIVFPL